METTLQSLCKQKICYLGIMLSNLTIITPIDIEDCH